MRSAAFELAVGTFPPVLRNLSSLLEKGRAHAVARKFDVETLVVARLAPDMYTLEQQVQLACYHAEEAMARLAGKPATPPETKHAAFDAMKERIDRAVEAIEKAPPSDFDGADDRAVVMPIPGAPMEFDMKGAEFLRDWAIPHFYFHVVTAYDILRNGGVELGKRDYLASAGKYLRPARTAATA